MIPRLLVLTDRAQLPEGRSLVDQVAGCMAGGATHFVLRELDLEAGEREDLSRELVELGAVVIAAHHPLPDAVGLHLPSNTTGSPPGQGLVGRSCHFPAEVVRAAGEGADYATLSPYSVTSSKPGYGPPLPSSAFRDLPIPTLALGGIDEHNAAEARQAGAHGVAVMGALMRTTDPEGLTRRILEALR